MSEFDFSVIAENWGFLAEGLRRGEPGEGAVQRGLVRPRSLVFQSQRVEDIGRVHLRPLISAQST